jgi:hypothetical protein
MRLSFPEEAILQTLMLYTNTQQSHPSAQKHQFADTEILQWTKIANIKFLISSTNFSKHRSQRHQPYYHQ